MKVITPDKIVVAVDTIILAIGKTGLEVLLVLLKNKPYEKMWALPGSVVGISESLDEAALRVVKSRVGKGKLHLEQMYCFGEIGRDIRGRSVSVVYFALLSDRGKITSKLSDNYLDINWFAVDKLPQMAFDHKNIIGVAREKLAYKLDEIKIIKTLLPSRFTLRELQKVHEVLLNKKIDKRNFIKKIKNDDMVVATGKMKTGGAHRPAKLFRFK